jgi:hypothetical protein
MAWLVHLSARTPYLTGIALPMMLIGAGQGGALAPLTSAGIVGIAAEDAGAAGGVTNVVHQVGGALGLAAPARRSRSSAAPARPHRSLRG